MIAALLDADDYGLAYHETETDRTRLDISPRRRHLTEVRHRRGRKSAASKDGAHRRRNKRNYL